MKDPGSRRRRGAALEAALFDAAWDELAENGYAALTFDAVARRAGTSRSVIYRRWTAKDAFVRDVMAHAADRFPLTDPATGSHRDDTVALLGQFNEGCGLLVAVMSAQMAVYFEETQTTLADLRDYLMGDSRQLIDAVAARAAERGEIDGAVLTPRIAGLPYDLLRHEVLMTLKPVPPPVIREIVDTIYLPLVMKRAHR